MLNLSQKLSKSSAVDDKNVIVTNNNNNVSDESRYIGGSRVSIRDQLLIKEVSELAKMIESVASCHAHFPNASELHHFNLTIRPTDGIYADGSFNFVIDIPIEYNIVPPKVKCQTRIWHPNISEDGSVCLSLLRQHSLDGYGWLPTRRLIDVVLGLNSLFTDLLDFDDPLNAEAADQWRQDKNAFEKKVRDYIRRFCK